MSATVLILPGIGDSGPEHWQSLWEKSNPAWRRVQQNDWEFPVCADWLRTLEQSVAQAGEDVVLVAHSLACLLVAQWSAQSARIIKAAFLVAPPDPDGPEFPDVAVGFTPVPCAPLRFPSIVVASSNDPYGSRAFAARAAAAWGSRFVCIGDAGHINAGSGFGPWPEGYALLRQFVE